MAFVEKSVQYGSIKPRIIIHGGAGNITHENMSKERQDEYSQIMTAIVKECNTMLEQGAEALEVAVHAVKCMEDDEHFNCSKGAVFNRDGEIELEASIMTSRGYRKRGVGCMLLKRTKNPIKLAKEMLVRGNDSDDHCGGAYGHSQLSGPKLEKLAEQWGLEMVENEYFRTRRRWQEHKRGLEKERQAMEKLLVISEDELLDNNGKVDGDDPSWDGKEYLAQGTVGAVVLDRHGTLCVATSTGGLTNKLPGRIGDTPTLGAGFWAEEWEEEHPRPSLPLSTNYLACFPSLQIPIPWTSRCLRNNSVQRYHDLKHQIVAKRAVAMSGTGNGDSFLRTAAVRTAAAMTRFSSGTYSLADAVARVAGPGGELQRSAEDRWGRTGEGEGGVIGIEFGDGKGDVVWDLNCGGMFRAWIDNNDYAQFRVFKDSDYDE